MNFLQQKWPDRTLSKLDSAIESMNRAKASSSVMTAEALFGSVVTLLTTIRVRFLFCNGELRVHM